MSTRTQDPRLDAPSNVRPVVAKDTRGLPTWALAAIVAVLGLGLFLILDARRQQLMAPSTKARITDTDGAPPPVAPLFVPPEPVEAPPALPTPVTIKTPPPPIIVRPVSPPQFVPPVQPFVPPMPSPVPQARSRGSGDPVLVFDNSAADTSTATARDSNRTAGQSGSDIGAADGRVRASVIHNRATTVVEGTLIPAVLESALDSTRPGPARALVTRDVRGFDGSRVLVPKGSQLVGEYKADLQPGQNRALVIWTRLVRPDGATIALASPSADTLGRVGIKGNVNSHFLERFGSALLQTSLNVGTGLAARAAGGDSIAVLTLPGALSTTSSPLLDNRIQRTLRVKPGVAISVFVARDLDFTSVEAVR